jgi:hypothetical protein
VVDQMNLPRGFSDWRRRQSGLPAMAAISLTQSRTPVRLRGCDGSLLLWADLGMGLGTPARARAHRRDEADVGRSCGHFIFFFSFFYIFYLYPVPMTCGPQGGRWTTLTTLWVRPCLGEEVAAEVLERGHLLLDPLHPRHQLRRVLCNRRRRSRQPRAGRSVSEEEEERRVLTWSG